MTYQKYEDFRNIISWGGIWRLFELVNVLSNYVSCLNCMVRIEVPILFIAFFYNLLCEHKFLRFPAFLWLWTAACSGRTANRFRWPWFYKSNYHHFYDTYWRFPSLRDKLDGFHVVKNQWFSGRGQFLLLKNRKSLSVCPSIRHVSSKCCFCIASFWDIP